MKRSEVFVACLLVLVGYIGATFLNRTSSGQPPVPQPAGQEATVWRYQLTVPIEGAYNGMVFLTDTATGHCCRRSDLQGAAWEDYGSPPDRK
jgi:hypothetical protein